MARAPERMREVLIRLPVPMYDAVKATAQENDRSIAAEIRRAIRAHLEASDA